MTQHILEKDTQEDRRTLRRLGTVIGGFLLATIILATIVSLVF